uniref:Amino acid transporter transmembrane domain-containing protein n=1 Tax=Romanomermis culicivorax TaxID=13658 RepID=A0A915ID72_ROMCU
MNIGSTYTYKIVQIEFGHLVQSAMCCSRPAGTVGQSRPDGTFGSWLPFFKKEDVLLCHSNTYREILMAYPGGTSMGSSLTTDGEKVGISVKQAVKYVADESLDAKSICQSIDESLSSSSAAGASSSKMDLPLLAERQGDVISSHKALLTLAKGFVGTGCLSLPFAWKQGGLWVSFVLQIVISALNWYSNHILAKSAQYLAARSARPSLDYGHFAKKLFSHYLNVQLSNALYATAILLPLILVNMVATMKALSYLAMTATFLWLFGALTMLQQCFRVQSQWSTLPAYTDFWSTIMFFGTAMYSYEGQTMRPSLVKHGEFFNEKKLKSNITELKCQYTKSDQ